MHPPYRLTCTNTNTKLELNDRASVPSNGGVSFHRIHVLSFKFSRFSIHSYYSLFGLMITSRTAVNNAIERE